MYGSESAAILVLCADMGGIMDYTSLIKEVNIPELVKALRLCQFGECGCGKCYYKELKGDWCTEDNHPEFFDCDDKLKLDAAAAIEELQFQLDCVNDSVKALSLPIDGKWERVEDGESYHYECTQCGERPLYTAYGHIVLSGTCPNCGAKMTEVQE